MINTFLCTLALIVYYIGMIKTPRKTRANGYETVVVGTVALISYMGLVAVVYKMVHIPISLCTISVAVLLLGVVLIGRAFFKKQFGKCVWPLWDGISLVMVLAVVSLAAIKCFGLSLNINYTSIDAARYFGRAIEILKTGTVASEFLTDLVNAMFLSFFEPFAQSVNYYKGFIVADIFVHLLSVAMFYILLSKVNSGRGRYCNPILTLLYFAGFQLYSLNGMGFMHWVDGMLMIIFLIYAVIILETEQISKETGILYLILALNGIVGFYPFFLIMVIPMMLPDALVLLKNIWSSFSKKRIVILGVLLLAALGGTTAIVGERVGYSVEWLLRSLKANGVIYEQSYMDYVCFIPVIICFFGLLYRCREENRAIARMAVMAVLFIVVWYVAYSHNGISTYYYYRMYYPLWLLVWLVTAQTIHLMIQEKKLLEILAYAAFMVAVFFISIGNADKIAEDEELAEHTRLLSLYTDNWVSFFEEQELAVSRAELDAYAYIYDNLVEEQEVPLITSVYQSVSAEWYRGITKQSVMANIYNTNVYSIYNILTYLQTDNIIILKNDAVYSEYYQEIFSRYEVMRENDAAVIYHVPAEGWVSVVNQATDITPEEHKFFLNVRSIQPKVPLIYDANGFTQAKYYRIYTDGKIDYAICEVAPEEFVEQTHMLDYSGDEYLAVLKSSEIFKQNQEYFYSQNILYEDEVGILLQRYGASWMPEE